MPTTEAGKALAADYPVVSGLRYGKTGEPIIDAIEAEARVDGDMTTAYMVGYEKAVAAERARIRAAVDEALWDIDAITRNRVLRIIDGAPDA